MLKRHLCSKTGGFLQLQIISILNRNSKKSSTVIRISGKKKFNWLRYSPEEDAAYCAHCLAFSKVHASTDVTFVTKGFTDWKNAVGDKRGILPKHCLSVGHQKATELAENYLSVVQGKKQDISSVLSQQYAEWVKSNRESMLSIIDIITNLGQRNIAFRGGWEGEGENGNFIHFVNWKAEFDSALQKHLKTAPQNAKYLSPKVQNELIVLCPRNKRWLDSENKRGQIFYSTRR